MKGTIAVLTFILSTGCADSPPQPVPPPPVPTPEMCPVGFGPIGDLQGCYRESTQVSWSTGEDLCEEHEAQNRSAHLLIIDREEEHRAFSMISLTGDIWLGRLQEQPDDEYRNINYIDYAPKYVGAGNCESLVCDSRPGGGDERCIEYKHETGLWNDEKCGRANRVFCEWDNVAPHGWRPGSDG